MTGLPSAIKRIVPRESSPDGGHTSIAHHDAVYTDPRVTDIDPVARYTGEYSRDNGTTWTPVPNAPGWTSVCGGHVQVEAADALLTGWDVVADGPIRTIREWDGALTRWTPTGTADQNT